MFQDAKTGRGTREVSTHYTRRVQDGRGAYSFIDRGVGRRVRNGLRKYVRAAARVAEVTMLFKLRGEVELCRTAT